MFQIGDRVKICKMFLDRIRRGPLCGDWRGEVTDVQKIITVKWDGPGSNLGFYHPQNIVLAKDG